MCATTLRRGPRPSAFHRKKRDSSMSNQHTETGSSNVKIEKKKKKKKKKEEEEL